MTTVSLPTPTVRGRSTIDVRGLAASLAERTRGEVRFDAGTRAAYSTDGSNYRQVPIGVVVPRDVDDAVEAVAVCRGYGAPILSRGGGTSLAGQCCNVAVMLDWSKYVHHVESVDPRTRTAIVQPGAVLDDVNAVTRRHHGLIFGPRPSTHSHCTIGGMVGNNSCGATAQWSGTTAANVRRLEILTYDGLRMWVGETTDAEYEEILRAGGRRADIYRRLRDLRERYAEQIATRFPDIPRRISGYNLPELRDDHGFHLARALVGTESTCVTVLRAEVRLLPEPKRRAVAVLGYPDIAAAGDAVPAVNSHQPIQLEGLDDKLIRYESDERRNPRALKLLPKAGAWLMVEFGGDTRDEARDKAQRLIDEVRHDNAVLIDDDEHREQLQKVREAGLGTTARTPNGPDAWPGWEDSAVGPDHLGGYLRDLTRLLDEFGYGATSLYGHFGHGCVHCSIPFDLLTAGGVRDYRRFTKRAADLVVAHGGSLSGEHGDGQSRGELLTTMYGAEVVEAFREFKSTFDPDNRMNPGKVVDARPRDADLRLGPTYAPAEPDTHFEYSDDSGSFARAALRCAGVGECRRSNPDGSVMCPSYQVTREEEHSTRGRARLLFEMLRGETVTDGWCSTEVADALDLCLACKGCKHDCPVQVDMATYKAEFLSHHYAGRIRPRDHYSLGWLPLWARVASLAPGTANAVTHLPGSGRLAKAAAGVDPRRDVPRFAAARFDRWMRRRRPGGTGERGPVVLFPDTFTTSFAPGVAAAAVGALEAAGFEVVMPDRPVCCGLTWISTGQLDIGRRVLRHTVDVLTPYIRAGAPLVGLEPSCTAVFRSDMRELLGYSADVERLCRQTRTFAELLTERAEGFTPSVSADDGQRVSAIVQTHCHQHAILGCEPDEELMKAVGLDARRLASGCCGLAGNFGMTPGHRDVSLACAEQALLPAVRDADPSTVVLADGFSCRTQIDDAGTGRRAVHLAEVVNAAVRRERLGPYPERVLAHRPGDRRPHGRKRGRQPDRQPDRQHSHAR
jgi:FAD/FMN-containing dehydrogenase/Fe-S oxidoreductase